MPIRSSQDGKDLINKYHRIVREEKVKKREQIKKEVIEGMAVHPANLIPKVDDVLTDVNRAVLGAAGNMGRMTGPQIAELQQEMTFRVLSIMLKQWAALPEEQRVAEGFAKGFVKPFLAIQEQVRKLNKDKDEMLYGKKITISNEKKTLADVLRSTAIEVKEIKEDGPGVKDGDNKSGE